MKNTLQVQSIGEDMGKDMRPQLYYLICTTPRTGSTFLGTLLTNTGLAGMPWEYFNEAEYSTWLFEHFQVYNFNEYLHKIFKNTPSSNGVFGAKVMGAGYFETFANRIRQLPNYKNQNLSTPELMEDFFYNLKYIWLTRRNKIRQAISLYKALQSGRWHTNDKRKLTGIEPVFDFESVEYYLKEIIKQEAYWERFFNEADIIPLTIVYEDFCIDQEKAVRCILQYLGISTPPNLNLGEVKQKKLADSTTEIWVRQYMAGFSKSNKDSLKRVSGGVMTTVDIPKVIDIISKNDVYTGNSDHYFSVGHSALRNIMFSLRILERDCCESVLDMPCGHGRVLRYIKAKFPNATLTACDINRDAVDFCVKSFNAKGVYSQKDLQNVYISNKFDLIWCGSLLTHLDGKLWKRFISFFSNHLTERGILIFSTHGRLSVKWLNSNICHYGLNEDAIQRILTLYKNTGFGYVNYPGNSGYGVSISSPSWVLSEVQQNSKLKIIFFTEAGWDNHHDIVACVRK